MATKKRPDPVRTTTRPRSLQPSIRIGCAGWSLSAAEQKKFPAGESHLARYAARFNAAEINSSFYRPHQHSTYAKWAGSVPKGFLFSVKLPKAITHEQRLKRAGGLLDKFLGQASGLGGKLGCLLIQLPPSLEYEPRLAARFFSLLRAAHAGAVALEPRHLSWFIPRADELMAKHRIGRVAADPAMAEAAAHPSGWPHTVYYRLHGSPRMYYSSYGQPELKALAGKLGAHAAALNTTAWCIFDNTASGAAVPNALDLLRIRLQPRRAGSRK